MINELEIYKYIGHRLPKFPHALGIANRVLKRIYNRKERKLVISDVLGLKMELNPKEFVDGNLLFCPQLYDYAEIDFILKNLHPNDVFVDVGAHIGFYSLIASKRTQRILAIEAAPETFKRLKKNIELNDLTINSINCGVSDKKEVLRLSPHLGTNAGGQSFVTNRVDGIEVQCFPLTYILEQQDYKRIKLMKLDVEGFEYKILKNFLENVEKTTFPKFIITEFFEQNVRKTTGNQIQLLEQYGYRQILRSHSNRLLELDNH